MNQIELFKTILNDVFRLKSKPHIVRKSNIMWPGRIPCMGMYYGDEVKGKFKHRIEYDYKTTPENIFTTLAHEYVHAWQMENGFELEHDTPEFIMWEKHFREYWDIDLQFT